MTLKLYGTPGDFLEENRGYLEANEAVTQLNRGNAQANATADCHPGLLFGRYEQAGQVLLLFGHTAPWNLCLNAPPAAGEAAGMAAAALAGYLRERGEEIAGVTGGEHLCAPFIKAYGGSFRLQSAMDIMILERLVEPPPVAGRVRKAVPADTETIARWMCCFMAEALQEECELARRLETDGVRIAEGKVWVMEDSNGQLVSTARTSRETPSGVCVSAVYTPPEYRGQGYCQNTVATLCREVLAGGRRFCSLFVNRQNPISNRVYRKIGFTVWEDCSQYKLEDGCH